jgi:hypothetical protein
MVGEAVVGVPSDVGMDGDGAGFAGSDGNIEDAILRFTGGGGGRRLHRPSGDATRGHEIGIRACPELHAIDVRGA